jgi:hypothetical protein
VLFLLEKKRLLASFACTSSKCARLTTAGTCPTRSQVSAGRGTAGRAAFPGSGGSHRARMSRAAARRRGAWPSARSALDRSRRECVIKQLAYFAIPRR